VGDPDPTAAHGNPDRRRSARHDGEAAGSLRRADLAWTDPHSVEPFWICATHSSLPGQNRSVSSRTTWQHGGAAFRISRGQSVRAGQAVEAVNIARPRVPMSGPGWRSTLERPRRRMSAGHRLRHSSDSMWSLWPQNVCRTTVSDSFG